MLQQCAVSVQWIALVAVMNVNTAVCCIGVMDSFNGCDDCYYINVRSWCDGLLNML